MMTATSDVLRMAYVAVSRSKGKAHIYLGDKRDYKAFKQTEDDLLVGL